MLELLIIIGAIYLAVYSVADRIAKAVEKKYEYLDRVHRDELAAKYGYVTVDDTLHYPPDIEA